MNVKEEIKKIDAAITELIYDKTAIKKAYNYYHKKRDNDQFLHIEENRTFSCKLDDCFDQLIFGAIQTLTI